jgi:leader peptidase (prepilin peptidase)/N-methyltransferase
VTVATPLVDNCLRPAPHLATVGRMTSQLDPGHGFRLVDALRLAHPVHVPLVALLLLFAYEAFGPAPGLVTALWLALVTPGLIVVDVRLKRLPNVLVVPGLVAVLVDAGWAAAAEGELPVFALLTTSGVMAAMFALNLSGGLGMGDVKLSGVLAGCLSLASPWVALAAMMLAFFLGGAYSAVLMLRHRGHHGRRIAFGPVLLVAFWVVAILLAAHAEAARAAH